MNRREFSKTVGTGALVLATGGMAVTDGCSWGNVIADLKNWIPVALSALSSILKILSLNNPIITLIQAGFAALLAAIQNYQSGTGILSDITNAAADIEQQFANFFASLSVPAPLLVIIEAMANVILSTLEAFVSKIGGTTTLSRTYKLGQLPMTVVPKYRTIRAFKKDWNSAVVTNGHPEFEMKLGFWEKF
jgi:hypothetical protein